MKKIICLLLFISASIFSFAQNTWVQKLTYMTAMQGYYDTLTGVKSIKIGADGSMYVLAHTDQKNWQRVYKFYPNSHQVAWHIDVAFNGSMVDSWVDVIKPTSDSGVLVVYNENYMYNHGAVEKFSKGGVLKWQWSFYDINLVTDHVVFDAIEKSPGTYYALVRDSMFTLDNSGYVIDSTGAIHGSRFMQAANGDLLVRDGNILSRIDTMGNVIWSQPCTGSFDYDTASVFIQNSAWFVKKVDAYTGIEQWNKSFIAAPISHIEATHDGGFMGSVGYEPTGMPFWGNAVASPGYLFRADSMGDTMWTRTYSLPHYGLYSFAILPNGNIFTGGCYLSGNGDSPDFYKNYSAFSCMMNPDGSYPLAQTNYVSAPDADNDHVRNFVGDALATMLAMGSTGVPRDYSIDGNGPYGSYTCGTVDLAIDWATSTNGVNHKYADFDGNGVVDTNDLNDLRYNPWCEDSIPLYYRLGNPNDATQSTNEFCVQPVHDTIQPGEDPVFYLILGSSANPIDSIYGFAMSYFITGDDMEYVDSATFYSTGLGTPGVNARSFQNVGYIIDSQVKRQYTMVCRTDFQNAYNVSDTIGVIHFRSNSYSSTITLTIADFKAILADGTPIPFSLCTGSIFIDSSSVSVSENEIGSVKIFPNPASHSLNLETGNTSMKKVVLMNSLGEKLKTFQTSLKTTEISVEDLPDGFYTGAVISDHAIGNFSFVVQH